MAFSSLNAWEILLIGMIFLPDECKHGLRILFSTVITSGDRQNNIPIGMSLS